MSAKILLIDDDEKLNDLLTDYLSQFKLEVVSAITSQEGLLKLKLEVPDIIILDVMLPGSDGFEVCKKIRQESSIPIIMLTARGEIADRVLGLELGADDYLPKPFEPRELVARINSVLRRTQETVSSEKIIFEDLEVDLRSHQVMLKGEEIELTTTEFELLAFFVTNPGKVFNRDEIIGQMRGIEWEGFNRAIDMVMSRLRHKLKDDPKKPTFFKTVWGTGYMFIGLRS